MKVSYSTVWQDSSSIIVAAVAGPIGVSLLVAGGVYFYAQVFFFFFITLEPRVE